MGFTGDEFVGVDSDAFGDAGADAQPLDTWLQNRLWGNTRWLAAERRCICWSPAIDNADSRDGASSQAGVRPFSLTQEYITVWKGALLLSPQQTGITLLSVANIWMPHASLDNHDTVISYRLGVRGYGNLSKGTWAQGDNGTNPQIVRDAVTFNFNQPVSGNRPELAYFELAIKSEMDARNEVADSSNATWYEMSTVLDETASPLFFENSAAGNPDADSMEVQALGMQIAGSGDPLKFDILAVDGGGVAKPPRESAAWLVQPFTPTANYVSGSLFTSQLLESVWYAPRCLSLIPEFTSESAGRIPQSQLSPPTVRSGGTYTVATDWLKGAMDSPPALQQVRAIERLHTRPRLVSMGPRGVIDSTETQYNDINYRRCWPFVAGDHGSAKTLLEETLYLGTEDADLELRLVVATINHDAGGHHYPDDFKKSPLKGDKLAKTDDVSADLDAPQAAWDFDFDIDQLDDTPGGGATWASNSTSYASQSFSEIIKLHPTLWAGDFPPMARGLELDFAESLLPFKEGGTVQKYGDETYLDVVTLRVNLSGMSATNTHLPMRLKLDVEHDSANTANDYFRTDDNVSGAGPESRLRLYLVSYTLWEIPQ